MKKFYEISLYFSKSRSVGKNLQCGKALASLWIPELNGLLAIFTS